MDPATVLHRRTSRQLNGRVTTVDPLVVALSTPTTRHKKHNSSFFCSKFKALETVTSSLSTIGVALENIQRRLNDMEAGDRRHGQQGTGRGVPAKEVCDFEHIYGSDDEVMPKPPSIRGCIKATELETSWYTKKKNRTGSYSTRTQKVDNQLTNSG